MKSVPWKLLAYIAAGLLILAGLNHAAAYIPFTPQWSAKRAEAKADRLTGQVSSLERTAEGNAVIGQAVETHHTREIIIREGTSEAVARDRSAPDATVPLTPERANRLHDADRVLCINTGLCGSNADPARRGAEALPDSDAPG